MRKLVKPFSKSLSTPHHATGSTLRLNYTYYLTKCINPALDRVLSLAGVDVFAWFRATTRPKSHIRHVRYDRTFDEQVMNANSIYLFISI
jgi:hypothetical protein